VVRFFRNVKKRLDFYKYLSYIVLKEKYYDR